VGLGAGSTETRGALWKKSLNDIFVQSNRDDFCEGHSGRSVGINPEDGPTSVDGQIPGQQNLFQKKSHFPHLIPENPISVKIVTEEDLFIIDTESAPSDDLAISDTNLGPGTG
jgi:hypothetical protein